MAELENVDGVVKVKDYFTENDTAYIVMEYLDGKTLKEILEDNRKKMTVLQTVTLLESVMHSLSKMHKAGIIHRDISLDNSMVTKDRRVKLIDLGGEKRLGNYSATDRTTPIKITLACCFSCQYCGSNGGKARENELSTEECIRVVHELKELGCKRVSLIGGEVFMRQDWNDIVQEMTNNGISVAIITNGYLFSENVLRQLKELQIESIAVSLDGPKEIHDKYRQSGSFARAIAAIQLLVENKIPVSVISTIHSQNIGYLEEFYTCLKTQPISAWQIQACSPMGNVRNSDMDYQVDFGKVIQFVEKHIFLAPFTIGIADNIGYYSNSEGYLRGNLSGYAFYTGCKAGITSIGIDSVGNVRGCESMYDDCFIEGNLREKSFREIWESSDSFTYNRKFEEKFLTGNCKKCEYRDLCAGGCRSYNYFTHGKLYEAMHCVRKN